MNSKLKKGDFFIIGLVLLLAAVLAFLPVWRGREGRLYAEVWQDGVLLERVELEAATRQTIRAGEHNTIVLDGRSARMAAADCRDQVCVHTGTLTKPGQVAACLPYKVVLKLSGKAGKQEVDAIAS